LASLRILGGLSFSDLAHVQNAVKLIGNTFPVTFKSGAVAQLGERVVRNDEATGSIPVSSTNSSSTITPFSLHTMQSRAELSRVFARWFEGEAATTF
jgi:hypothetical protein